MQVSHDVSPAEPSFLADVMASLLASLLASARTGCAGVWAAVQQDRTFAKVNRWLSYFSCFMRKLSICIIWFCVLTCVMGFTVGIMQEQKRRQLELYTQRAADKGEVAEYTSDYVQLDEAVDGMWKDYNKAKLYYATAMKHETDAKLEMDRLKAQLIRVQKSLQESIETWEMARKSYTRWKIVVDDYEAKMRFGNEQLRQRHPLWDINE